MLNAETVNNSQTDQTLDLEASDPSLSLQLNSTWMAAQEEDLKPYYTVAGLS